MSRRVTIEDLHVALKALGHYTENVAADDEVGSCIAVGAKIRKEIRAREKTNAEQREFTARQRALAL